MDLPRTNREHRGPRRHYLHTARLNAGDQSLVSAFDLRQKMRPAAFIQFRQNIIEEQHRPIASMCAYELDLRQFHRKHRRSLLTLGSKSGHVNTIEFEQNVIAVRPAHCDASDELDSSKLGKTILEGSRDRLYVGRLELNRRHIPHGQGARRAGNPAVRFAAQPVELGNYLGPPRYDPGAYRNELFVPGRQQIGGFGRWTCSDLLE